MTCIGRNIGLVSILAASAEVMLLAGCRPHMPAAGPKIPTVQVVGVVQQDVPVTAEWVATLDGYVNAHIRAQVSGYLLTQDYQEGAVVAKGDLLFEIDPREFQAELDKAQAALGKTQLDVQRLTPLAKENAVSQQELDDAVQANLANLAAVEQAKLNLGFARVISPIDGVAGIASAQIGDLVGPTSGDLAMVSTVDPIKAYFAISEQEYMLAAETINAPKPITNEVTAMDLILADGSLYPHRGRIAIADRQVDVRTGTIRLAALFPNPGNILRPGQFARVRMVVKVKKDALLVPQRAVTQLQSMFQVAVITPDNKVQIRSVQATDRVGPLWVIDQGLNPGEQVVAEGVMQLKDGIPVNPQPYAPAAAAPTPPAPATAPGK